LGEKIDRIRQSNRQDAQEAPYNHCDRWCERCPVDIQKNCRLYLDEIGRKAFNIAHGRDPDDLEILEKEMEEEAQAFEAALAKEEYHLMDDDVESLEENEEVKREFEALHNKVHTHPLWKAAWQYCSKAREFLKSVDFPAQDFSPETKYHLETITWYHTLLSAKMNRALTGFYETDLEHLKDHAACDAVAQLDVCQKAVEQSLQAFKMLAPSIPPNPSLVSLTALLNNIRDQIHLVEQDLEEKL